MTSTNTQNYNFKIRPAKVNRLGCLARSAIDDNAVAFDAPFVAVQAASIVANQLGDGYLQVMILNIILLLLIKLAFGLIKNNTLKS